MKKKLIAFGLLAGLSISGLGAADAYAKNCKDEDFYFKFKFGNSYDHTSEREKGTKSYYYVKTEEMNQVAIMTWAQAEGHQDASDGHHERVFGPGVTLLYNLALENYKPWYREYANVSVGADKNTDGHAQGKWSPDYCS